MIFTSDDCRHFDLILDPDDGALLREVHADENDKWRPSSPARYLSCAHVLVRDAARLVQLGRALTSDPAFGPPIERMPAEVLGWIREELRARLFQRRPYTLDDLPRA